MEGGDEFVVQLIVSARLVEAENLGWRLSGTYRGIREILPNIRARIAFQLDHANSHTSINLPITSYSSPLSSTF